MGKHQIGAVEFTFMYEGPNGDLCEWATTAISRYDAIREAEKANPEIMGCCIEIQENN